MTWAQQWQLSTTLDSCRVFDCGGNVALFGQSDDGGVLQLYALKTGAKLKDLTADDFPSSVEDAAPTDTGAVCVGIEASVTNDPGEHVNLANIVVWAWDGSSFTEGVVVGSYRTYDGTGMDFVQTTIQASDPQDSDSTLSILLYDFGILAYLDDAGQPHVVLTGLAKPDVDDDSLNYPVVVDYAVTGSGSVTAHTIYQPTPPPTAGPDRDAYSDGTLFAWESPISAVANGGGLLLMNTRGARYTAASGTVIGVGPSSDFAGAFAVDTPSGHVGDTQTAFVDGTTADGYVRHFTFSGIS